MIVVSSFVIFVTSFVIFVMSFVTFVMYIELHAASAFSFLRGASLPETLVERAAALGYPALALLDQDGVYGAPRFHKAARSAGLRPLIGAELTIETHREPGGSGNREPAVGSRQPITR